MLYINIEKGLALVPKANAALPWRQLSCPSRERNIHKHFCSLVFIKESFFIKGMNITCAMKKKHLNVLI
jgi:hypothetical protein